MCSCYGDFGSFIFHFVLSEKSREFRKIVIKKSYQFSTVPTGTNGSKGTLAWQRWLLTTLLSSLHSSDSATSSCFPTMCQNVSKSLMLSSCFLVLLQFCKSVPSWTHERSFTKPVDQWTRFCQSWSTITRQCRRVWWFPCHIGTFSVPPVDALCVDPASWNRPNCCRLYPVHRYAGGIGSFERD